MNVVSIGNGDKSESKKELLGCLHPSREAQNIFQEHRVDGTHQKVRRPQKIQTKEKMNSANYFFELQEAKPQRVEHRSKNGELCRVLANLEVHAPPPLDGSRKK